MPIHGVARTLKLPISVVQLVCQRFVEGGLKLALESELQEEQISENSTVKQRRKKLTVERTPAQPQGKRSIQQKAELTDPATEQKAQQQKDYNVKLDSDQQKRLTEMTYQDELPQAVVDRIEILLLANAGCRDEVIAKRLQVEISTVFETRRKFVEGGIKRALCDPLLKTYQKAIDRHLRLIQTNQ